MICLLGNNLFECYHQSTPELRVQIKQVHILLVDSQFFYQFFRNPPHLLSFFPNVCNKNYDQQTRLTYKFANQRVHLEWTNIIFFNPL